MLYVQHLRSARTKQYYFLRPFFVHWILPGRKSLSSFPVVGWRFQLVVCLIISSGCSVSQRSRRKPKTNQSNLLKHYVQFCEKCFDVIHEDYLDLNLISRFLIGWERFIKEIIYEFKASSGRKFISLLVSITYCFNFWHYYNLNKTQLKGIKLLNNYFKSSRIWEACLKSFEANDNIS